MEALLYKLVFLVFCAIWARGWTFVNEFDYDRPLKKLSFYVFTKNKTLWKAFFGCGACVTGWTSFFSYPIVFGYDIFWPIVPIMGIGVYLTMNKANFE